MVWVWHHEMYTMGFLAAWDELKLRGDGDGLVALHMIVLLLHYQHQRSSLDDRHSRSSGHLHVFREDPATLVLRHMVFAAWCSVGCAC